MIKTNMKTLLDQEFHFFDHIFRNHQLVSNADKHRFRLETVTERRKRLSEELFIKLDGQVQAGEFKGLRLNSNPSWGIADQATKLLGLYEQEVINEIYEKSNLRKKHFIDLGAADGYYAIGALLNGRFEQADCFEIEPSGQDCIRKNAEINNILKRLKIYGEANENFFQQLDAQIDWNNVFILCDVEGAEFEIFSESTLESIKGSTILIEIHNWIENFLPKYEALLMRAAKNYKINTLSRVTLQLPDFQELHSWPDDNRALILSEGRPNVMRFLKLTSK